MKKNRTKEILKKLNGCEDKEESLSTRLARIECLIKHIVENDLPHIWIVLKIILGAIVSIAIAIITTFLKIKILG